MNCQNNQISPKYTFDLKPNAVHSWKDMIPLSSVSDGIWSEPGNSKEFHIGNGDEAVEQAAAVDSRADRLRSSVIHEQKHFLGKRNKDITNKITLLTVLYRQSDEP